MKTPRYPLLASAVLFLGLPLVGFGQTTWDFGGTPSKNWSTFTNWSTDADPSATAVAFGNTGLTANATTVGNIVDTSYTSGNSLTSLTYGNTGTTWQVTQIASGQTLTDAGAFRVGTTQVGAGLTTLAAFTGTGTLAVNASSSSMTVASSSSTGAAGRATLDMSNLSTFTANVATFSIGTGTSGSGTLYLADNSTITATTLATGGSGSSYGGGVTNTTLFGTTTVLNIDTLSLGGRTYGTAKFRGATSGAANTAAVSGATLTIRGSTGGTSRMGTMTIGDFTGGSPSGGSGTTSLDLTGGSVDALVTNLTIGTSNAGYTQNAGGLLSMAAGTFDATTVILGQTTANSGGAGTMTGTLNVSGGTFTAGSMTLGNNGTGASNNRPTLGNLNISGAGSVNVTGNLVMGVRSGAATVTPMVTVSSGTLTVGGNLAEGTGAASITSTVNLSGGTLDMTHGTITVDTFAFTGGTLKNVTTFTGSLNVQNTATLGFDLDGASPTLTLTGLTLGGSSNLGLSLLNGITPDASYTLASGTIVGTFFTINGAAFGSGNTFTLSNNLGTYNGTLTYSANDITLTLAAIPEPSTYAMLAGVLALGLGVWRRTRSRSVA